MSDEYRIFGIELSPFSVKVRSYFRYKRIPHRWIIRGVATQAEFEKYAKGPLIPLVVPPEGDALQDSTRLIEEIESRHPEPALQPPDPPRAFLSSLIEEYADEWTNKAMFHFRWAHEADQLSASQRIARAILGMDVLPADLEHAATGVRERMVARRSQRGSDEATAELIEASFRRQLEIAEAHLTWRPYLFGGRPCLADLGWASQMYELANDPTGQALMQFFPYTLAWVSRMQAPEILGDFEPWSSLAPTLTLLLQEEVARRYLPWAAANAQAVAGRRAVVDVDLGGETFSQTPQQSHVQALQAIRQKAAAALAEAPELDAVLRDTGCHDLLVPAA